MISGKTTTTHNTPRGVRRIWAPFASTAAAVLAAGILVLMAAGQSAARAESAVSVLCYHTFIEKKKMDPYSFTLDELSSHVMQLKKEGFRFVSVGDIIGGRISGTKNILVSVDDGNRSVYEAYHKVFRPNGIRPLLGIYPNIIVHKKKYALTWEQLKELADSGCDIAAHGYFHLKVTSTLYDKDPKCFRKEIFLVKKVLEENLKRKITLYIYPFGLRDETTMGALKEAGYRYAFTIDRGRIDVPLAGAGDRQYELPRYMVTRTSWSYCFDRVMKNARPKVAYRVAAAGARERIFPGRPDAAVHDPSADPSPDQVEWIYSAAFRETGLEAGGDRDERLPGKKKIGVSEPVSAERGYPVFDPPVRMTGVTPEAASAHAVLPQDPAGMNSDPGFLNAGMERSGSVYERRMKARYGDITVESSRAYRAFLGRVKEKIERIRSRIRRYVVANF